MICYYEKTHRLSGFRPKEVYVKITVQKGKLADAKSEAVILVFCEDEKELTGAAVDVDKKVKGLLGDVLKSGDFTGRPSEIFVVYARGAMRAKRIALVGLGKRKELNLEKIRSAFSRIMQHLRGLNIKEAATSLDWRLLPDQKNKLIAAVVEGVRLGLYQFTPYKTVSCDEIKEMRRLAIVTDPGEYPVLVEEIRKATIVTDAVCFARDLISAPANEMTPAILAAHAAAIARRKNVKCIVLDKGKMKALGMNALLGVAAGSHQPPKLIILEYNGGKKGDAPLALVGKGLTFDSGGISLKPAEKMDEMKTDMSGGAAVLAVIMAAADLQLPVNLVGLVPATENMSGGGALKPGDILRSYSGRTIEVLNTDAEGRLILADALTYASKYKPAGIIDIATLTGACVVALGEDVIGMLGTDEKAKKEIYQAAQTTGELVWELPLWDNYSEMIKSDIADYKNSAGRMAGAITAAAFLSKFVDGLPWVHLDIAGPSWTTKDKAYTPKGASGVAVRLLLEYIQNRKKQ
ncbi:MAG: leucyl aminopeptidase [Deltaproteobacteria bacterium]|nr:leucyl aminopeptidase [Deltaproteobacteria bacterium]